AVAWAPAAWLPIWTTARPPSAPRSRPSSTAGPPCCSPAAASLPAVSSGDVSTVDVLCGRGNRLSLERRAGAPKSEDRHARVDVQPELIHVERRVRLATSWQGVFQVPAAHRRIRADAPQDRRHPPAIRVHLNPGPGIGEPACGMAGVLGLN